MRSSLAQFGRDSLVYGVLDVANRFVGIFLVPLYTRVLAPADYGTLDLVLTLVTVAYAGFYLGLDSALSYYFHRSDDPLERRRVSTTALLCWVGAVSIGAALMIVFRGPVVTLALPDVTGASRLLVLGVLGLPVLAITQVQMLVLRLRFSLGRYAALSLLLLVVTVALNVYFVLVRRMGVEGILLAILLARAAVAIIGAIVTRGDFVRAVSARVGAALVRYGAPLVLSNLSFWMVLYFERYALLRLSTLTDVGLFGIGVRVATFVTLISMAIDMAWVPFAMSIQREPDAQATYARILTYYLLLAGLVGTALALFAREALVLLTQPEYYGAAILVGPIAAALILRGAFNIVAIGAMIESRTRLLGGVSVAGAGIQVLLLLALVPVLGALGAAFATLLTRLAALLILHASSRTIYHVPWQWGRILRITVAFSAAVAAGIALSGTALWTGLLIKLFLVVPVLALVLLATGGVTPGELRAAAGALTSRMKARKVLAS